MFCCSIINRKAKHSHTFQALKQVTHYQLHRLSVTLQNWCQMLKVPISVSLTSQMMKPSSSQKTCVKHRRPGWCWELTAPASIRQQPLQHSSQVTRWGSYTPSTTRQDWCWAFDLNHLNNKSVDASHIAPCGAHRCGAPPLPRSERRFLLAPPVARRHSCAAGARHANCSGRGGRNGCRIGICALRLPAYT